MTKGEEKKEIKNSDDQGEKSGLRHVALFVVVITMVIFTVIILFTSFLGDHFGKSAEMTVLVIVALVLAYLLYKSKRR